MHTCYHVCCFFVSPASLYALFERQQGATRIAPSAHVETSSSRATKPSIFLTRCMLYVCGSRHSLVVLLCTWLCFVCRACFLLADYCIFLFTGRFLCRVFSWRRVDLQIGTAVKYLHYPNKTSELLVSTITEECCNFSSEKWPLGFPSVWSSSGVRGAVSSRFFS